MQCAVLLVSHGTIDDLDDLAAFLANIRQGRAPSADVVTEMRRRYEAIGGKSPLNAITREVAQKLEALLGAPVAWANRLWRPTVRDALASLAQRGVKQVALVPLAQHSAHVYANDARRAAEGTGLALACAPNWGTSSKLRHAFADRIVRALGPNTQEARATTVVMTAHSLPRAAISRGDSYESEIRDAAADIAAIAGRRTGHAVRHVVAFQSQAVGARDADGNPVAWLGPGVREVLDQVSASGDSRVLFAPIGFLADHVEILYDLDIEAKAMAEERKLTYARARSLNADDDLIDALAEVARPLMNRG